MEKDDLNKKIKKAEMRINDFIVNTNAEENEIFNNVTLFYWLSKILEENLESFVDYKNLEVDYRIFTKKGIFENIDLIKSFYKKHKIILNLDELLADGTIEYKYCDYLKDDYKWQYFLSGVNYYRGEHKAVESFNNGLITDAIVLVHELSHYQNQTEKGRNLLNDLLTETVALTDEEIFLEYLLELGYERDVIEYRKYHYLRQKAIALDASILFKFLSVYKKFGDLSLQSYLMIYENDTNYNSDIMGFLKLLDEKKSNIYMIGWYVLGYSLSSFMLCKYREDSKFMEVIQQLHQKISNCDMLECLSSIGLKDLCFEDIAKISKAIIDKQSELSENIKKTLKI